MKARNEKPVPGSSRIFVNKIAPSFHGLKKTGGGSTIKRTLGQIAGKKRIVQFWN